MHNIYYFSSESLNKKHRDKNQEDESKKCNVEWPQTARREQTVTVKYYVSKDIPIHNRWTITF